MRIHLLILAITASMVSARDIVPGVVSFDEPPGFRGFAPHRDPGDSPFILSRTVIQYQPDTNSYHSFRQFDIGIGVAGYVIGEGKRIAFRSLSEDDLKNELIGKQEDSRVGISLIEAVVSDRKAYLVSWRQTAQALRPNATLYTEFYYVPFEPNRGVTLNLTADSEEGLLSLRQLLTRVAIPKEPREIAPLPPPEPTLEQKKKDQITRNLRLITRQSRVERRQAARRSDQNVWDSSVWTAISRPTSSESQSGRFP
jgi:hypothetical protein